MGNFFLYLLLTTIGAQADLRAVVQAPLFLLVGCVWVAIHGAIIFLGSRLFKAPIVASVYQPSLAPVGLLLAVLGNITGIYGGRVCAGSLQAIA